MGQVARGVKKDVSFTVSNEGDEILYVTVPGMPCSCLVAGDDRFSILPGAGHELRITFDTTDYAGRVSKDITLITSDPIGKTTRLSIIADVVEPFQVPKRRIAVGQLSADATAEISIPIILKNVSPRDISVQVPDVCFAGGGGGITSRPVLRIAAQTDVESPTCEIPLVISSGICLGATVAKVYLVSAASGSLDESTRTVEIGFTVTDPYIDVVKLSFGVVMPNRGKNATPRDATISIAGTQGATVEVIRLPRYLRHTQAVADNGD